MGKAIGESTFVTFHIAVALRSNFIKELHPSIQKGTTYTRHTPHVFQDNVHGVAFAGVAEISHHGRKL